MYKKSKLLGALILLSASLVRAQTDNSPYSRYGLGDQLPSQNLTLRGMGGVGAAYSDAISVNYLNPASYARLKRATFDFGLEVDSRTLRVTDPPRKFSSTSANISYVQLGLPLSQSRNWGMNIGLRPVTRINYKILKGEKDPDFDSSYSVFEGNGGSYEVYTGTGFSVGKFTVGFNAGYLFGTKSYSTKRTFSPDSLGLFYYPSEHSNRTSFGGIFGNAGLQYTAKLGKENVLRLGAHGSLRRNIHATRDDRVQTYRETEAGIDSIDVIKSETSSGRVVYPASYGAGLMFYAGNRWLLGADYSQTKWSDYRFFGTPDLVQDSWKIAVGGQVIPDFSRAKSYWGRVAYRAGINYGQDYIAADGDLPVWGFSFGFGLPLRQSSSYYSTQFSIINTTFEFGQRGNKQNDLRESFFRVGLGLTLSDLWFRKRVFD